MSSTPATRQARITASGLDAVVSAFSSHAMAFRAWTSLCRRASTIAEQASVSRVMAVRALHRELHHRLVCERNLADPRAMLHDTTPVFVCGSLIRLLNGEEADVDAEAVRLDELPLRPLEVRPSAIVCLER